MKTNVAVFFGGRSTEHEISVISAIQAMNAIDVSMYNVIPVYITKKGQWFTGDALMNLDLYRHPETISNQCTEVYMKGIYGERTLYRKQPVGWIKKNDKFAYIDVAFPVLHGSNGEDGSFQGFLSAIGIPFVGCDVLSSAIGMDKIIMKMILESCHIPIVPFIWFTDKEWYAGEDSKINLIEMQLRYPVIVKPANLGSSVGIGRADNVEQLKLRVAEAAKYSSRIIVERMIENMKEINCSVLGDCDNCETSVLEEPIKTGELLSYEDKYLGGTKGKQGMAASSKRIPAQLDEETTVKIKHLAAETFRVLSCNGVSRVDVMIDMENDNVYVNEINTIPGSLSFYLWEASGVNFTQLTHRLISLALKRNREINSKITSYQQNIFNMNTASSMKNGIKNGKLK